MVILIDVVCLFGLVLIGFLAGLLAGAHIAKKGV